MHNKNIPTYSEPPTPKIYHCGTLTYTTRHLAILFFWLLWGDFCYTVMESVTGPIMQLKFQALNASNTEIGLILGTIPGIVYSFLNPIISFKSDRYRSAWGRRIPFILFTLPFLVLFLLALAFGNQIGLAIAHLGIFGKTISSDQVVILTLGTLLVSFTFFNTFVTSTFWYLFNDVVPEHLLARFMAWFRVISTLSAAAYMYFIFPYSGTHSTQIFVSAALLYFVGFGLMCTNVKEGEYPPPTPYDGGGTGPIAAIKTYGKETHSFMHYWYLWFCTFIGGIGGGVGMFGLFFSLALGLSMKQISVINTTVLIAVSILTIGTGWLADRFHPIRVVLVGATMGLLLVTPSGLIWLFWLPSPTIVFYVSLGIAIGLTAPAQALSGMWDPPMLMRLFPRSHYGQFCSTNAVWRAMGGIIGGGLSGAYLDIVTHFVGKERAYFYIPIWSLFFAIPSYGLLIGLYFSWKRYGGDDSYVPPVLTPKAQATTTPPQPIHT